MSNLDLAFILCIEKGFLEEQSLLLCESIRRYAGAYSNAAIYAFSPRAGETISQETRLKLKELQVEYFDQPLNTQLHYFPYANKNYAAAYVEKNTSHDGLVFLDSDTIFFREPTALEGLREFDALVRPVDVKGICSSGPNDPVDQYWQALATACGVDLNNLPIIATGVDGVPIRANYNGGFVAVKSGLGIFQKWLDNIESVHACQLRTGPKSFWGTGQSTLTMALHANPLAKVGILPRGYNFPLNLHHAMKDWASFNSTTQFTHVHYHWMFEAAHWRKCHFFTDDFQWERELGSWLVPQLPLREIRPPSHHGVE